MDSIKVNDIVESLKKSLSAERFEHTLGVAEMCVMLGKRYGVDEERIYLAGLLHDCAKCLSDSELLTIIENNSWLKVDESEKVNPKTFHAPAGVIVAKERFGIIDEEILSSIRWHTLGKKDMSIFEKIVYLADKMELRTRPVECRLPLEQALKKGGIDAAILESYRATIQSLVDRNLHICYTTIDIYNDLLRKVSIKK